jgi:hypothetical protein
MRRPLLPTERTEVSVINLDGIQSRSITDLVAATMFQVGLLLGAYPTARTQITLRKDDTCETLVMQVTMTVPLEELGV